MSSTSVMMSTTATEIVNQIRTLNSSLVSRPNLFSAIRVAISIVLRLDIVTTEQKGQILDLVIVSLFENELTPPELALVKELLPALMTEMLNLSSGVIKLVEDESISCWNWLWRKKS